MHFRLGRYVSLRLPWPHGYWLRRKGMPEWRWQAPLSGPPPTMAMTGMDFLPAAIVWNRLWPVHPALRRAGPAARPKSAGKQQAGAWGLISEPLAGGNKPDASRGSVSPGSSSQTGRGSGSFSCKSGFRAKTFVSRAEHLARFAVWDRMTRPKFALGNG